MTKTRLIEFADIAAQALRLVETLVPDWLPDGKREGDEWITRNPKRSDRTPGSFKVNLKKGAWSDFATGDAGRDLISLFAYLKGLKQNQAAKAVKDQLGALGDDNGARATRKAATEQNATARKTRATAIWEASVTAIPGSPVDRYLRSRGIEGGASGALRYHNKCPYGSGTQPCMMALIQDLSTGTVLGVHRTPIKPDGRGRALGPDGKALDKKMLGSPKGGGVLLGQLAERMILAEGIETALSVQFATGIPAIAALSAGGLKTITLPTSVRELIIFADHDKAGLDAARKAGDRLTAEGRVVSIAVAPDQGDDANDLLKKGGSEAVREAVSKAELVAPASSSPSALPRGFRYDSDGNIEHSTEGKDGEEWHRLCSPLEVLARTSDEEDKNHGLLIAVTTVDGKRHLWALPMELLAGAGDEYRKVLLNIGLRLASGKNTRNALHDLLMRVRPKRHMTCVERAGWHGRTYVLPTEAFGEGAASTVFQVSTAVDHRYAQRGSLEDWKTNIADLADGNAALMFAISVALAAPLVRPLGEESGIFNYKGESSTGKTTALRIGCSVYGSGADDGFKHSWRITDNALEGLAHARCDGLVALDEMSQVHPNHVGAIAYMYANGSGKGRADRLGNARSVRRWSGLLLSTGEQGIADLITEIEREVLPGQLVRFVDIPVSEIGEKGGLFEQLHGHASPAAFAKHLAQMTERFHGTAGPAFLKHLTENYEAAIAACRNCITDFVGQVATSADGAQVQRVARRFGLVAAAGELAIAAGIVTWEVGSAFEASLKMFRLWKAQRGTADNAEGQQALDRLRAFLEQNDARFARKADEIPRDCAGFFVDRDRANKKIPPKWLIYPSVWRSIFSGRDPRGAAKKLAEMGVLVSDQDSHQKLERIPGNWKRRKKFYAVTEAALGIIAADGAEDA